MKAEILKVFMHEYNPTSERNEKVIDLNRLGF